VVKGIEEVHAEAQAEPFLDLPVLGQLHIGVDVVRALASAASSGSDRSDLVTD
jgi:hypothetical protein